MGEEFVEEDFGGKVVAGYTGELEPVDVPGAQTSYHRVDNSIMNCSEKFLALNNISALMVFILGDFLIKKTT